MNDLSLGWQLMGYGLAGVFSTLIVFMLVISLVTKVFPEKPDQNEDYYSDNQ